jgi:hypothetical protein
LHILIGLCLKLVHFENWICAPERCAYQSLTIAL